MTKYFCDRCKRETRSGWLLGLKSFLYENYPSGSTPGLVVVAAEICGPCHIELQAFMNPPQETSA